jgi:hypothetical protein
VENGFPDPLQLFRIPHHAIQPHQCPFFLSVIHEHNFGNLLNVMLVIYLDNILIYSISPADHPEHIWEVLRHLRKHGMFVKPEKCEWGQDSVEFLGFHCSTHGREESTGNLGLARAPQCL